MQPAAQGGCIRIASAPIQGSTFSFTLPAARARWRHLKPYLFTAVRAVEDVFSYLRYDYIRATLRSGLWSLVRGRSGGDGTVTEPVEKSARSDTEAFERTLAAMASERYVLRLYVAGNGMRSRAAIENVRRVCDERLRDRFDLEIVDIHQNPAAVTDDLVLATPTLVRRLPAPLRLVIGDLSEEEKVLVGLALIPKT